MVECQKIRIEYDKSGDEWNMKHLYAEFCCNKFKPTDETRKLIHADNNLNYFETATSSNT